MIFCSLGCYGAFYYEKTYAFRCVIAYSVWACALVLLNVLGLNIAGLVFNLIFFGLAVRYLYQYDKIRIYWISLAYYYLLFYRYYNVKKK